MHLPEQAPTPSRDSVSQPRDRFASWMLIACLLLAVGQLGFNAATLDTWMDEGKYLMKGYWYFTGKIAPYSTVDPSFYMPLSFYSVAPMEWLFGVGYLPGRVLVIVFALGCLVLAMVSCLSLALVFVLLVVRSRVLAYGTSGTLLRPRTGMVRMAATELAAQLRSNLPATGRILVLCDSVEAAQAVWLAGGVVEPRSMYLPSTFRARSQG